MPSLVYPLITPAGDCALSVEFGAEISPEINDRVHALARSLSESPIFGVRDCVPSYAAVLLCFDPGRVSAPRLTAILEKRISGATGGGGGGGKVIRIPVCYEGDFAPDMADVCKHTGFSPEEIIRRHTKPVYRIYMLGFLPGFPYLGGLDPALETPRLETPRTKIPAGAVGIGGAQTGIYPLESPGGWRLIGRTPVKPYDPARSEPFLYGPGDRIEFYPISRGEYDDIQRQTAQTESDVREVRESGGSNPCALTVINGGMLTTVQDEGRFGYMDKGFSPGGSLDGFYSRLANFLVGNPAWEAVLEMTVSGADLRFDSPAVFALTGADMNPLLNGNPVPMHRAVSAAKGDIFHAGFAAKGLRAYFAVAGGFGIEPALGSRSTNLRSRIGGFEGRKLQTRDVIPLRWTAASLPHMERRVFEPAKSAFGIPPSYTQEHPLVLRVVQGGQSSCFTEGGIAAFYSSVYTVRPDSDRMGVRLDGPAIESRRGTDIVSDGIALGAIQVPGSGKPIVLLNDRQTTGGYAKIGAVVTSDLWRLSQAPPGSALRFERISDADAENLYVKTGRELAGLEKLFSKGD